MSISQYYCVYGYLYIKLRYTGCVPNGMHRSISNYSTRTPVPMQIPVIPHKCMKEPKRVKPPAVTQKFWLSQSGVHNIPHLLLPSLPL
jgi:hypothetical protein